MHVLAFVMGVVVGALGFVFFRGRFRTPASGHVLICRSSRGVDVERTTRFVWPVLERAEEMSVGPTVLRVERTGANGLRLSDGIRMDVCVRMNVRVKPNDEAIIRVADKFGARALGDSAAREDQVAVRLLDAMSSAFGAHDIDDAFAAQNAIGKDVIRRLKGELGDFLFEDFAFDRFAMTPPEYLDPDDVLDADALAKVHARLAASRIKRMAEERIATQQTFEARLAIQELEAEHTLALALAEARAQREIAIARTKAATELALAEVTLVHAREARGLLDKHER